VVPISIRFERFTFFHTPGSAGSHDFNNIKWLALNLGEMAIFFENRKKNLTVL
jgi:hypothetical protein